MVSCDSYLGLDMPWRSAAFGLSDERHFRPFIAVANSSIAVRKHAAGIEHTPRYYLFTCHEESTYNGCVSSKG